MSVFIDTGPWYASVVPADPRHGDTLAWLRKNDEPLVTTDYIIDETLTLLLVVEKARGPPHWGVACWISLELHCIS